LAEAVADRSLCTWRAAILRIATEAVIGQQVHTLVVAFGEPSLTAESALPQAVTNFSYITRRTTKSRITAEAVIGEQVHAFVVARGKPYLARQVTLPGAVADFSFGAYLTGAV
jgi:hypothetical protein